MWYIRKKFLKWLTPPPPRRQHFREKIFRCFFYSKSAPQILPSLPQLLEASYAPGYNIWFIQ
jgi:hypothetical protein